MSRLWGLMEVIARARRGAPWPPKAGIGCRGAQVSLLIFLFSVTTAIAADWPHWRGPQRNDIVQQNSGWQHGHWINPKPDWAANVGEGSTSPLVIGNRLYVMGWKGGRDDLRCLNASTGKLLWSLSYKCPEYGRYATGDKSLYGGPTSTPEYDPQTGYLYTLSCDGDLNCWNTRARGKKVWGTNLYNAFHVGQRPPSRLEADDLRDYGYSTSPYVYGDWLLVEVGSKEGSVVAFDKRTGARRWLSEYRGPAGQTGGLVPISVAGIPCVAVLTFNDLLVLRLDRGHEGKTVATYPWKTAWDNNDLTPTVQGNCVLISSWHTHHSICKVRITLRGARRLWEQRYESFVGSPVIDGNRVYMAGERLVCLDWNSGKLVWRGGSYGYGGACIVTGDGRLIVWSNLGRLTLVAGARQSPKAYRQLARLPRMFGGAEAWPHPALADGRIYCKDRKGNLKCFALPKS